MIDKERVMTPHRPIGRKKNLTYTDHFTMVFILKDLPKSKQKKQPEEKMTVWNTNKPVGWDKFKELTEENYQLENLALEEIFDPTYFNEKFQRIMTKVKFRSFGKVTFSNRCKSDKPLEKLYNEKYIVTSEKNDEKIQEVEKKISDLLISNQRKEYERKLVELKSLKESKGGSAATFRLRAKILGEKKEKQESVVVEDPSTEEIIFEAKKIKSTSLNYLKNLLTNREPKEDYENDIKVIRMLHKKRMKEKNDIVEEKLSQEDFDSLIKILKKKSKSKYKFILFGGKSYHKCLIQLFNLIWYNETKPSQWENTIAHQLYKGKGVKSKLSNYRFIHTKNEDPKFFEHILMSKAKPKIIQGCSKFQIGALPKHQSQEHLFTLKSVIEW